MMVKIKSVSFQPVHENEAGIKLATPGLLITIKDGDQEVSYRPPRIDQLIERLQDCKLRWGLE